jgi:hypothetical protein
MCNHGNLERRAYYFNYQTLFAQLDDLAEDSSKDHICMDKRDIITVQSGRKFLERITSVHNLEYSGIDLREWGISTEIYELFREKALNGVFGGDKIIPREKFLNVIGGVRKALDTIGESEHSRKIIRKIFRNLYWTIDQMFEYASTSKRLYLSAI